jgi:hypothetical protein
VGELGSSRLVAGATAVLAYLLTPMVGWVAIRHGVLARPNDRFAAHPVPARAAAQLRRHRGDAVPSSGDIRRWRSREWRSSGGMPPGLIGIGGGVDPGSNDPDGGAGHGVPAEGGVTDVRPVALFGLFSPIRGCLEGPDVTARRSPTTVPAL